MGLHGNLKFNLTELDYEFHYFIKNMSCRAMMRLPYSYRCQMARQVGDCKRIINLFNYFRMMYCSIHIDNKITEVLFMFLFAFICVAFLWLMSFNIGAYFSPVLKIISLKLHMNEYLAGVTLLAFGNCSPEIIANLMPVRADAPIFTIAVGNTLAIILLSGGTVCFLRPFKMNGHCTLRDLLFLLLGVEVLRFVMNKEGAVTMWEGIVLFFIYVVYVVINIADVIIMRFYIKKLRKEVDHLGNLTPPPTKELQAKLRTLTSLEVENDIQISDTTKYRRSRNSGNHFSDTTRTGYFVTPKPKERPEQVDHEANRTNLHNSENPKNLLLFTEFLWSLNPIDGEAWQLGGKCNRLYLIVRSPLVFVMLLFIPVVDFEKDKHGWSKLLNCTQIVTNPFVIITLVHSAVASVYHTWYITLNIGISMWSPCITIPLAIAVFLHSRTDVPPFYHQLFIIPTFLSSMVTLWIAVTELEVLSEIVGIVFNLSETFMAVTFEAVSNATPDIIANSQLAMQGYGRMAFAAIIGGPVFAILISMSLAFIFNHRVREVGAHLWVYGDLGDNCYIFLVITIVTTLWWCVTFNFYARRSAGVFLWLIYLLFLIYAVCVEWELVHPFSRDEYIDPI
ncbi:mitochondrial sodium/calcium exchanger protein isoform X2 [Drosophila subpulchrella]|uniref:mitochondrial sodium/calcium exchanger protein isoform X2 n=1 Tax=Drosophila subpulchrella TaxID=1486046 RepID=UPI0018A1516B|nr:mitochondrial sodium/calcium exchanger protein isoform X2 [Drosophila subpulchrella]